MGIVRKALCDELIRVGQEVKVVDHGMYDVGTTCPTSIAVRVELGRVHQRPRPRFVARGRHGCPVWIDQSPASLDVHRVPALFVESGT